MKDLHFVAVDVDDNAYHVAIVRQGSRAVDEFACKPSPGSLVRKLKQLSAKVGEFRICYEATYLGFSLKRALEKHGFHCDVISPAHIPTVKCRLRKTDRLDSRRMADFYMKGLLTVVHAPSFELEMDRDILRSRRFIIGQLTAVRRHILSICRRLNWDFRQETPFKAHWTKQHIGWLIQKIDSCTNPSLKVNLKLLFRQLQDLRRTIDLYDEEIAAMASRPAYAKKVEALVCYRGFEEAAAMTVITELGDISRFPHPRHIVGYAGLDVAEASSGGKEIKFHITKAGSRHLRTALVEACQTSLQPLRVSRLLKARRAGKETRFVEIADRCMARLHKKGTRLLYRDKPRNKIKTACAREMIGFVWESLRAAA